MRRIYFAWLIILSISCVSFSATNTQTLENCPRGVFSRSSTEGPTIDWPYSEESVSVVIAWDGIYNGQTEEVWKHDAWVNDSDGVDCVLFQYRWRSHSEWINRTTTMIEGNDTTGLYFGNFTYEVWWNWDTGYPGTEGDGGNFFFKIFANDTLGNWNEVVPVEYIGGYYVVISPTPTTTVDETTTPYDVFFTTSVSLAIIGSLIIGSVLLIVASRKYR